MVEVVVVLQLHGSDEFDDLLLGCSAELFQAASLPDGHEHAGQRLLMLFLQLEDIYTVPLVDRHFLDALKGLRLQVVAVLLLPPVPDDRVLQLHSGGDHLEALDPPAASHVHVQPRLCLAPLPCLPLLQPLRGPELLLHPPEGLLAPLDLLRPLPRLLWLFQDSTVLCNRHGGAGLQRGHQVCQTAARGVQVTPITGRPPRSSVGHRASHHRAHRSVRVGHNAVETVAWRLELREALNSPLVVSGPSAICACCMTVAHRRSHAQHL
mmetsp:Transcript_61182/g.170818  ORF Transcript_61182/g.170818 Transcript_61182/m.170818 type:complete len:266 (-) Transcript_61182:52-849(-)